jgi:hypothetical protein
MTDDQIAAERVKFEAFVAKNPQTVYLITRYGSEDGERCGDYAHHEIQWAWWAWKERAAAYYTLRDALEPLIAELHDTCVVFGAAYDGSHEEAETSAEIDTLRQQLDELLDAGYRPVG